MFFSTIFAAVPLTSVAPACSWDHSDAYRYCGNVAAAVDHYSDIPATIRPALWRRIRCGERNQMGCIGRDSTICRAGYEAEIRDMRLGASSQCATLTSKWTTNREKTVEVYCEGQACLKVPLICSNRSRIRQWPAAPRGRPPTAALFPAPETSLAGVEWQPAPDPPGPDAPVAPAAARAVHLADAASRRCVRPQFHT